MKKIVFLLTMAALIAGTACRAQNGGSLPQNNEEISQNGDGIAFEDSTVTLADACTKAKAEGKMIFIDCYTSWCGPCKRMAREIFPQKVVGDFFNKTFVCLKKDMEKGEGVELQKKYSVRAFPTLLFLDESGNEVNRIVGAALDAAKFVEKVKGGLGEGSLTAMNAKYDAGRRDTAFVYAYLWVLGDAMQKEKAEAVTEELIKGREQALFTDSAMYNALMRFTEDKDSPAFIFFSNNKDELYKHYPKDDVDWKIWYVWFRTAEKCLRRGEDKKYHFSDSVMTAVEKEMAERNVDCAEKISWNMRARAAQKTGNFKLAADYVQKYHKKYKATDYMIGTLGEDYTDSPDCGKDKKLHKAITKLVGDRLQELKAKPKSEMYDWIPDYEEVMKKLAEK